MRTKLMLLLFFFGFLSAAHTQQWIENGKLAPFKVDLKYKRGGDKQQAELNRMMASIAYSHQKPVETIAASWELIASYQVTREEKGNFKSDIFIKPKAPEGDLTLYEFNSAEAILPVLKSFRLRIFKEDSSLVYLKIFDENPISVGSVGQIANFTFAHQRWSKGWYMEIDQAEFAYHFNTLDFEKWFQFTNDYKAAFYLTESLLSDYRALQQKEQKPQSFLMKSIIQANKLKKLYQLPFYKATIAAGIDPGELGQKMNILSTLYTLNIEKYKKELLETNQPNTVSVDDLVQVFVDEELSIRTIQQAYPGIYDHLFQEIRKTNYPENLNTDTFGYFDIIEFESAARIKIIDAFENKIYTNSIANIEQLILNEQFAEALYAIENIENFKFYSASIKQSDLFTQYKARAAYGMYYSYANIIDKAIALKNTSLAEQYIIKANQIQKTYPELILTNSLIEKKMRMLVEDCYADFSLLLEQNRYDEVISKRDTIRELINSFQLTGVESILRHLEVLSN
ncbi:MAG: hypothetical protein JW857_00740 [Bacteroidales bacterium]|nr:hypothetical protein [Bacteroidales bacterium]